MDQIIGARSVGIVLAVAYFTWSAWHRAEEHAPSASPAAVTATGTAATSIIGDHNTVHQTHVYEKGDAVPRVAPPSTKPPQPSPPPTSSILASPAVLERLREKHPERIILDREPREIMDLYHRHTTYEADKLAAAYLGKWLAIVGPFDDLDVGAEYALVTFSTQTHVQQRGVLIFRFGLDWIPRLEVLRRGDPITILGQIRLIDATRLNLRDCELVG